MHYNPFYNFLDPLLIVYYCLNRIKYNNVKSLATDTAAIVWFCEQINTSTDWRNSQTFKSTLIKIHKLFFLPPDKAEPIFPSMVLNWLISLNINIHNAFKMPLDLLVKILIIQIISITGMRLMELLRYNKKGSTNGIRFGNIKIIRYNKQNSNIASKLDIANYIRLNIDPGQYKNAKSRLQPKEYIIGDTYHNVYNPYYYFVIYSKRMRKYMYDNNIAIDNNSKFFRDSKFNEIKYNHVSNWMKAVLIANGINYNIDNKKFTIHGFRSGIATWLRAMGVPMEQICHYVGWSDKFLRSAAYGYFRFSNKQKAALAKKIIQFKPKKELTLIVG